MNNENELTVDELETITGHFGEMLDDPELDDSTRIAIERVYKKVAKQLGVWDQTRRANRYLTNVCGMWYNRITTSPLSQLGQTLRVLFGSRGVCFCRERLHGKKRKKLAVSDLTNVLVVWYNRLTTRKGSKCQHTKQ